MISPLKSPFLFFHEDWFCHLSNVQAPCSRDLPGTFLLTTQVSCICSWSSQYLTSFQTESWISLLSFHSVARSLHGSSHAESTGSFGHFRLPLSLSDWPPICFHGTTASSARFLRLRTTKHCGSSTALCWRALRKSEGSLWCVGSLALFFGCLFEVLRRSRGDGWMWMPGPDCHWCGRGDAETMCSDFIRNVSGHCPHDLWRPQSWVSRCSPQGVESAIDKRCIALDLVLSKVCSLSHACMLHLWMWLFASFFFNQPGMESDQQKEKGQSAKPDKKAAILF